MSQSINYSCVRSVNNGASPSAGVYPNPVQQGYDAIISVPLIQGEKIIKSTITNSIGETIAVHSDATDNSLLKIDARD